MLEEKVPHVTLRNPQAHEMSLGRDLNQIKEYGGYDPDVSPGIHQADRRKN